MYKRGFVALVPRNKSQRMTEVMEATGYTLRYWLLGQGITMVTVGMLTTMGLVFGFLGALVATPLTAVVMVWIKMLYVQDVLGKPVSIKE